MESQKKHFVEMIQKFGTGMLVTKTTGGCLHGRPMTLARADDDAVLYFATSLESAKRDEIDLDPDVGVFFQDAKNYVSVYGTAEVVRDPHLMEDLWQETWRAWFPDGKESRELCLLKVNPVSGEYWDMSGTSGVSFAFEALKAYVTGSKPHYDADDNAKVVM